MNFLVNASVDIDQYHHCLKQPLVELNLSKHPWALVWDIQRLKFVNHNPSHCKVVASGNSQQVLTILN
jgi:hypothetical protein